MNTPSRIKLGFVPANRGSFSQQLAAKMRDQTIQNMDAQGIDVVVPTAELTKAGCVQSFAEAEVCARLFRDQQVQGIVIGAVNFGDEQASAWAVRQAGLNVPVFIFGCQEESTLRPGMDRRDAFCGLLSIGETLRQIGARYSVGRRPVCFPKDQAFLDDLDWFVRVCRVVNGVKRARYGQIGARPDAFWTCRFDEKQLQRLGPTTVTLDLSEVIGGANRLADDDAEVKALVKDIRSYADAGGVAAASLLKMAKLELFLRRWAQANAIDAFAIQCWTSVQQNFGICACTTMSRLGDARMPAACEADILGTLSMHACQLASGGVAALADWNNLHNKDDELVNLWHCGVFPRSLAKGKPRIAAHEILISSGAASREQAEGIIELRMKESPLTLFRVTQSTEGEWKAVVAHGEVEDNPASTGGSYGWCRVRDLQSLYRDVLLRYFPHHVAITQTLVGNVLWEAFGNYLGFDVYHVNQSVPGAYQPALPFGEKP